MNDILNFINNNKSVTFIGMPGTGKTYTTDYISNKYNIPKIELDENIEKKYNNTLSKIINIYGEKEFKNIEYNAILDINFDKPKLISTGGSVIYSDEGMKYLKNDKNIIIYLKTDFDILKERTENFTNRGIIFNGYTPKELYNNRSVLYEKYADYIYSKVI
tara:strand:+ start:2802 stop:3284 length:483 start_codon:yes stop_codon:yes gene_type:complete